MIRVCIIIMAVCVAVDAVLAIRVLPTVVCGWDAYIVGKITGVCR